jgi:hypothetical protein
LTAAIAKIGLKLGIERRPAPISILQMKCKNMEVAKRSSRVAPVSIPWIIQGIGPGAVLAHLLDRVAPNLACAVEVEQ